MSVPGYGWMSRADGSPGTAETCRSPALTRVSRVSGVKIDEKVPGRDTSVHDQHHQGDAVWDLTISLKITRDTRDTRDVVDNINIFRVPDCRRHSGRPGTPDRAPPAVRFPVESAPRRASPAPRARPDVISTERTRLRLTAAVRLFRHSCFLAALVQIEHSLKSPRRQFIGHALNQPTISGRQMSWRHRSVKTPTGWILRRCGGSAACGSTA